MNSLPIDIVRHIITYDKRFTIRKNKLIQIIPRDDYRIATVLTKKLINIKYNHVLIQKTDEYSVYIDVIPCKDYFIWRMVILNKVEHTNKIYHCFIK
jgi:hypothetical protein